MRLSNPYSTVVAGVGALSIWFVAANAVQLLGFLGFVSVLLTIFGCMVTAAAVLVGFGAVLLTRGGRRPDYPAEGGAFWGDPWDEDLGFGGSPSTPPSEGPVGGPAEAHGPDAGETT